MLLPVPQYAFPGSRYSFWDFRIREEVSRDVSFESLRRSSFLCTFLFLFEYSIFKKNRLFFIATTRRCWYFLA